MKEMSKEKQISYKLDLILSKLESVESALQEISIDNEFSINQMFEILDSHAQQVSNPSIVYISESGNHSTSSISHIPE